MILRRNAATRTGSAGTDSSVRSAGLEMALDHETGEMDGRVLAGRHEGRLLSELTRSELLEVARGFRRDAESLRLLEGYLDRAHPGWRDDVQADQPKAAWRGGACGRHEHEGSLSDPGA